jgi:hypothetical protein
MHILPRLSGETFQQKAENAFAAGAAVVNRTRPPKKKETKNANTMALITANFFLASIQRRLKSGGF